MMQQAATKMTNAAWRRLAGQLLGGDDAEEIEDEDDERQFEGEAEADQHLHFEIDERLGRPRACSKPRQLL